MQIKGNVAIVTGGASGLGAATARALAEQGARVGILDFNENAAAEIAHELGGISVKTDVSDAQSMENAVQTVVEKLGPARILINCAGVAPAKKIFGRNGAMPLEEFSRTIQVNLIGTFNALRVFTAQAVDLEPCEDGERAIVINTASIAAFEGQIGQAAYAASKGGVAALTLPAARELANKGIRVVAIAPGTFETPMLTAMPQEVQDALAAEIPFPNRLGKAQEFADLALHVVHNIMINGTVLRIDGALRMNAK